MPRTPNNKPKNHQSKKVLKREADLDMEADDLADMGDPVALAYVIEREQKKRERGEPYDKELLGRFGMEDNDESAQ